MRNPLNSWNRSDTSFSEDDVNFGQNDLDLMVRLTNSGNDHAKFLRFIDVCLDIRAPMYWWKEWDTYKVGTVANSCSTMHTIHKRDFDINDFSTDGSESWGRFKIARDIDFLNDMRRKYVDTKDKTYWRAMIQALPMSYMQLRTVKLNYAVIRNMYHSRKEHKLIEWRDLCSFFRDSLPLAEQLIVN